MLINNVLHTTSDNNYLQQSAILQFTHVIKSHCVSKFTYFFVSCCHKLVYSVSLHFTSQLPPVCLTK